MSGTAGNTTSSSDGAPAPRAPEFDHASFVFNVDVFILCVLALFVLLSLPHAVIRYTHFSEWVNGHFLRSVNIRAPPIPLKQQEKESAITQVSPVYLSPTNPGPTSGRFIMDNVSEKSVDISVEDHTTSTSHPDPLRYPPSSSAHANLLRNTSTSSGKLRRPYHNPPAHMAGWSSMLPFTSWFVRYSIRPGLTVGQALLLLGYSGVMLYAGLYKSNPFTDPVRAGFVAVSQAPVIVILATKNNVPGVMLGMSYERLNFLHRFAGLFFVVAANVHSLGYIYKWTLAGTFTEEMQDPTFQAGLVALVASDILAVFSIPFVRQKLFNIFIISHVSAVIALLVALYLHSEDTIPYIWVAVGAYALDRLCRLIKTRFTTAHLNAMGELGMTRIELPNVNAGWRAGQHVRIRVFSLGMGWFGWAESHPFTIASVSEGFSEEGIVLMCKKTGKWTNNLFEVAKRVEYGEAGGVARNVKVLVEGPYGGPGHKIFSSFSGALLVAGGSGITFGLGALQELMQKDLEGESRLKTIELVWIIQDPSAFVPLLPLFTTLLSLRTYATVKISVHYTRNSSAPILKSLTLLPRGLTLTPGRPRLGQALSDVIDQACALSMFRRGGRRSSVGTGNSSNDGLTGVIVGVCGPGSLAEDVRTVVRDADKNRRKAVGGIEVHEEAFGC